MTAVVDERFVEDLGATDGRGAEEEPVVVGAEKMIGGEGEGSLEHFLADCETAAEETEANEVAGETAEDVALDLIVGVGIGVERGIGDDGIVRHDVIALVAQVMDDGLDLVREPHIVLIADEDVVALCMTQGILEIGGVASLTLVLDYAYAGVAECTDDIERVVGGAVVGDDHFIVLVELLTDGGQLLGDISGTVVGGNTDGDHLLG